MLVIRLKQRYLDRRPGDRMRLPAAEALDLVRQGIALLVISRQDERKQQSRRR